jgi:ATP-dependent DNA helicase RecQ
VEYLHIPIGAQPDRYYDFDLAAFCKNFKLEATPASYALKLLEQEGLWTMSDAVFSPSTIYITANRQELDELTNTYPQMANMVATLLRLHGTIFHYPTPVRLAVIAKQLRQRQEEAEAMIQHLHRMEILEYNKPKDGPQLFFHHYRVDSRHLIINTQRIATLRQQHKARVDAMIAYLENTHRCRNTELLAYFGERTDSDCGHCDVCAARKPVRAANNINTLKDQIRQLLAQPGMIQPQHLPASFPVAIRGDITTLLRQMIDEGEIKINSNGALYIAK